ncbi:MAG: hypothetical protein KAT28_00375 [Candidatus Aenigmarchaeota archaeon]|nr:hypothetical protein [Candidatus Aenigmarchaeota archaeon]
MVSEIDWDKVPEDRIEEARCLDDRLRDYESGFYHNYGNKVTSITVMSGLILDYPNSLKETIPVMKDIFRYLDAVYEELNFEKLPVNKYTEHYFACRDLYPDFKDAFETLEEQVDDGQNVEESLKGLKKSSLEIVDKMDRGLYGIITYELFDLKKIPGCENRDIHRKIPKNYQSF